MAFGRDVGVQAAVLTAFHSTRMFLISFSEAVPQEAAPPDEASDLNRNYPPRPRHRLRLGAMSISGPRVLCACLAYAEAFTWLRRTSVRPAGARWTGLTKRSVGTITRWCPRTDAMRIREEPSVAARSSAATDGPGIKLVTHQLSCDGERQGTHQLRQAVPAASPAPTVRGHFRSVPNQQASCSPQPSHR